MKTENFRASGLLKVGSQLLQEQVWGSGLTLLPEATPYICLLSLLMLPHPSGDVAASKRPFLTPRPSRLGKMTFLSI